MKKALVLAALAAIALSVFASEVNGQRVNAVSSETYDALEALYISEGMALPSTSGPWTTAELEGMLSLVDRASLGPNQRVLYDHIKGALEHETRFAWSENVGASAGIGLNFKLMAHANPKDFDSVDDWGGKGDWNEVEPFLRIPLEVWTGSGGYGYFELLQANYRHLHFDPGYGWKDMFIGTNIPGLSQHAGEVDTSLDFPNRGFVSFGGSWWNLLAGRDRASWGPGISGNFQIGDHIPFLDSIRLTTFSEKLKFIMNITSFYHPANLTYEKDLDGDGKMEEYVRDRRGQHELKRGSRMFVAHRLEWRALRNLNLSVTESYMYSSLDTPPDAMLLNPSTFFHNFYIRSNSNSLLSFDGDATPLPGWNIHFQLAIDEINGEAEKRGPEAPMAFGFMLGTRIARPLAGGVLRFSLEAVRTDAFLYLRDSGQGPAGDEFGINFVVPVVNNGSGDVDWNFLGYRYGGDAIVGDLRAGYDRFEKFGVEGALTYVAHGCVDRFTRWRQYWRAETPRTPTSVHPDTGSYQEGSDWKERDAVSHTVVLNLNGKVHLPGNLDLAANLDLIHEANSGNRRGRSRSDLQFSFVVRLLI